MKDDELVAVMVPRRRLLEVCRLLGTEPPPAPVAEPATIRRAYLESSPDMRRFLDLLAARPDTWLGIAEVRDALGVGVHELAGILSTLPRRWRSRYGQTGPLPFEMEGSGSRRRYRMSRVNAELIRSLG